MISFNTVGFFFFLIKILSISAAQCCILNGIGIKRDKLSTLHENTDKKDFNLKYFWKTGAVWYFSLYIRQWATSV